jgi:2-polyprenyl-3-methyl-5-hydroxy-6-metoxy-1,4-benzoquinol methylase
MAYTLSLSEQELARYREMAAFARRSEGDAWQRAGAVPGARIADVGCGPAVMLCELAKMVGPQGWVDGVERDEIARSTATAIMAAEGIVNARVNEGLATATRLEPGTYDLVMTRHVLVHNGGDEAAIVAHLGSLLRPGGHLFLVESDLSAVRRVPDDDDLRDMEARWLGMLRAQGNDLAVGARLRHLMTGAGLTLVESEARYDAFSRRGSRPPEWAAREAMLRAGLATETDVKRWELALTRLDDDQRDPIVYVPMFRAVGRRPSATG